MEYPNTLRMLLRHLPHIGLVRSFRQNLKKKIMLYNIPLKSFFLTNLLRVNKDNKYHKTNIVRVSKSLFFNKLSCLNSIFNIFNKDNLFELNIDTNLKNLDKRTQQLTNNTHVSLYNNQVNYNLKNNKPLNKDKPLSTIASNNSILLRNTTCVSALLKNHTLYKYLVYNNKNTLFNYNCTLNTNINKVIIDDLNKTFFNSRINIFKNSNLIPTSIFKYSIKRKLLKIINFHKFSSNIIL